MATASASSKVIYLGSAEGKTLLENVSKSKAGGLVQPILYTIFSKQVTPAGCGMQSCAMLLSANDLGKQYDARSFMTIKPSSFDAELVTYTESSMYSFPQTLHVTNKATVLKYGTTLSEVAMILKSHGCTVKEVHSSHSSPAEFRSDLVDALSHFDSRCGIIVNFSRSKLWPNIHRSHHSPLGAYDPTTDCVLVLDTGIEMSSFWVSVEDLFTAMSTRDYVVNRSRGYCVACK